MKTSIDIGKAYLIVGKDGIKLSKELYTSYPPHNSYNCEKVIEIETLVKLPYFPSKNLHEDQSINNKEVIFYAINNRYLVTENEECFLEIENLR